MLELFLRRCLASWRGVGIASLGCEGWKLRTRAVELTAAFRFFGVFEGVGSMVKGSLFGGASEFCEGPQSESESSPFAAAALRWLENGSFLGVF